VELTTVLNAQDFQLVGRKNGDWNDGWMGCGEAFVAQRFLANHRSI